MRCCKRWICAVAIAAVAGCGGSGDGDVTSATAPPTAASPASLQIDQTGLLLTRTGETAQLSVTLRDSTGQSLAGSVTWESTRPGIVAIDSNGRVSAQSSAGSAQIIARSGPLVSPPLLVAVSAPAAGVRLVADEDIDGLPADTDPDAVPSRSNTYYVTYGGAVALPGVGARLLGTGSKPLAGEVVAVDATTRRVTLRPLPLRQLLPQLQIDEVIDLNQVEPLFPEALLAAYTVTKVGQRYFFVPKPGIAKAMAGARAKAASGTAATPVFPFDRCVSSLTGVTPDDGNAPLPLALSAPPTFSFSMPATLEVLHTPANGLERAVLHAIPSFTMAAGLKLTAALNGSLSCKVTLGEIPIPVTGAISWLVGGIVPFGVGAEMSGSVTLATLGASLTSTTSAKLDLGVACTADECNLVRELSNFASNTMPVIDLPSTGDFRVDLSAGLFGFADLEFGTTRTFRLAPGVVNRILRSLRVQLANAKLSGKMVASLAPRASQVTDETYKSNYKFVVDARAGLGQSTDSAIGSAAATSLEEIAAMLGVTQVLGLELSTTVDVARSPTGTFDADRHTFQAGDELKFRATLADVNQILGGAYNVARVLLVRSVPGGTEVVARLDGAPGQTVFDFVHTASGLGRTDEFYAFVTTRAFDFNLPEGLELFPFEIARAIAPVVQVAVSPATLTIAPGASHAFTALVTGTSITSVTWSASAGSITPDGVFTAPQASGLVTVVATSVADPRVTASASASVGLTTIPLAWFGTVTYTRSQSFTIEEFAEGPLIGSTETTISVVTIESSQETGTVTVPVEVTLQGIDGATPALVSTGVPAGSAALNHSVESRREYFETSRPGCVFLEHRGRSTRLDSVTGVRLPSTPITLVVSADGKYSLDASGSVSVSGPMSLRDFVFTTTNPQGCAFPFNSDQTQVLQSGVLVSSSVPLLLGVITDGRIKGSTVIARDLSDPQTGQTGISSLTVSWDLQPR